MALNRLKGVFTSTAEAIREVAGISEKLKPESFCEAVREKCSGSCTHEYYNGEVIVEGEPLPEAPKSYHLTNANELPTDAVDGSLAVVEGKLYDGVMGIWYFNEHITLPNKTFVLSTARDPFGVSEGITSIGIKGDNLTYGFSSVYNSNEGWFNETYREILIGEEPTDSEFITWLKANAVRVGGYPWGYWKFKDEVEFEGIDFELVFLAFNISVGKTVYNQICVEDDCLVFNASNNFACAVDEEGNWLEERLKTIFVQELPPKESYYWLASNANTIIPTTLYSRENGEWVSKGEI